MFECPGMRLTPGLISRLALFGLAISTLGAAPLRVLYFTKSAGYEHSVIKWDEAHSSYSQRVLEKLAATGDYQLTFSKDGSLFSPEYFAQFDVIAFYTSGVLSVAGTDGNPAVTPAGKQALLDAIAGGKGFVGIHSCSDTWHTHEQGGGNNPERRQRFRNYGAEADDFVKMLGGEFIRHGAQQVAAARVVAPAFPGFGGLGAELKVMEEWYTLKEFAPDMHVLLVMDTRGMVGSDYQRPDYPIAWARHYGKGRVAYNAMGHREDVWDSAAFQAMLGGMLKWAGGAAEAPIPANLAAVAPQSATIQEYVEPPPPAPKKAEPAAK